MRPRMVFIFVLLAMVGSVSRVGAADKDQVRSYEAAKGRKGERSEIALVHEALSGFVSGVQQGMPGIAAKYFAPENMRSGVSSKEQLDEFYAAIRSMKRVGDNPILLISMPRISLRSGKATVDCYLIWHFQNENGEIIRVGGREHLTLVKYGYAYRVVESVFSQIVLTHRNGRQSLLDAMRTYKAKDGSSD